jgi:hypothetical protein
MVVVQISWHNNSPFKRFSRDMNLQLGKHSFHHFYVLHRCDLNLWSPRKVGHCSVAKCVILHQLLQSLVHSFMFGRGRHSIEFNNLSWGDNFRCKLILSVSIILVFDKLIFDLSLLLTTHSLFKIFLLLFLLLSFVLIGFALLVMLNT